jgi:branched-chain amino acid aminotransferase
MKEFVYINGNFVEKNKAAISVHDGGFQYGDAVFEGIRVFQGRIFKLGEHVNRLYESASAVGLQIPISKENMESAIIATARKNGMKEGRIKPIVTRGTRDTITFDPRLYKNDPSIIILVSKEVSKDGSVAEGKRVIISKVRRNSPQCVDPKIKCCNYMNNILARIEAAQHNVDDAVMLDLNGFVSEATSSNIFIVKRRRIVTPSVANCLDGITRGVVVEIARDEGYIVEEKNITPIELYNADEVFLTGSGAGIQPIVEIDGRTIGNGKTGSITKRILNIYSQVRVEGTPIYEKPTAHQMDRQKGL